MRQEDLEYLRCPACSSHLQVDRFRSNGTVVFEGVLRCERDHCYPVIDAIPRFTPEVLAEHRPEPLPDGVAGEIDRIVERAEKEAG